MWNARVQPAMVQFMVAMLLAFGPQLRLQTGMRAGENVTMGADLAVGPCRVWLARPPRVEHLLHSPDTRRGGDDCACFRPIRSDLGHFSTLSSVYSSQTSSSSSASMEKNGVDGLEVQSDRGNDAGEEGGEVVGEESGDVEGIESDELGSSEDGSGDRGGSSKTSGSSTTGTARVPVATGMKNDTYFRSENAAGYI